MIAVFCIFDVEFGWLWIGIVKREIKIISGSSDRSKQNSCCCRNEGGIIFVIAIVGALSECGVVAGRGPYPDLERFETWQRCFDVRNASKTVPLHIMKCESDGEN